VQLVLIDSKRIATEALLRSEAVLRVLERRSTVPGEAVRLGIDAILVADWVNMAKSAVADAMIRCMNQSPLASVDGG
jgi:hypothetical protein